MNKKIYIVGGGTVIHNSCHLGLCAPAFGSTANKLEEICKTKFGNKMDIHKVLTSMAGGNHHLQSPDDLYCLARQITQDSLSKIVFWNPAVCDFSLEINNLESGKYAGRLDSKKTYTANVVPFNNKIIKGFRRDGFEDVQPRKDIFLIGFKATCGVTEEEQYKQGLNLLKTSSCNLVLANDTKHRRNMIIVPEEASYHITTDRQEALENLVDIAFNRSHLTFTRSTVVRGEPINWEDPIIPPVLKEVVDYCINKGAYRKFLGVTAGHFACKIGDNEFLTSRRKTDFNDMKNVGLVRVITDGPDNVIAYGSKPSVGGQSQRIIFSKHDENCVVHFHCPIKEGSKVPIISQREYECGSHQCGQRTSNNLKQFGNLKAVYLDNHGPNIVFNGKTTKAQEVINFINDNFKLDEKTGGLL